MCCRIHKISFLVLLVSSYLNSHYLLLSLWQRQQSRTLVTLTPKSTDVSLRDAIFVCLTWNNVTSTAGENIGIWIGLTTAASVKKRCYHPFKDLLNPSPNAGRNAVTLSDTHCKKNPVGFAVQQTVTSVIVKTLQSCFFPQRCCHYINSVKAAWTGKKGKWFPLWKNVSPFRNTSEPSQQ